MSAAPNCLWNERPETGGVSVIIPVFNEAATIAPAVEFANRSTLVDEVIVKLS